MKYTERMARRGAGARPFHTAITTTFSIEFAAYEEVMLPQLMASGATNFLLVADARMASMSLSDGSQLPAQLGRDYELFSPPISHGLFHPKLVLQIGRKAGRLFVGSANITAAGLAGNAETVVELECADEPSPEREIVRSAWRYAMSLVPEAPSAAREALNWAADRAPWLAGPDADPLHHLDDGTAIAFLTRNNGAGIGRRFVEFIGSGVVDRLIVASPYWDERLDALRTLVEALEPSSTTVLLDGDGHEFPLQATQPMGVEFRTFPSWLKGRFKHAKFLIASTPTHDHVLIGSANCTTAALGRGPNSGANAEACIYRALPRDRAVRALGLSDCIEADALDPEQIRMRDPSPPIPLTALSSRSAGSFELEGNVLVWVPAREHSGNGSLLLLDGSGFELGLIEFQSTGEPAGSRSFAILLERPERISFVVVAQDGFTSNPSHVTHRCLLRQRRREVATGSIAKAIAIFDAGGSFDLWMHSAFDELARADLNDHPRTSIAPARPRSSISDGTEKPPHHLTYEEFMETRSPDTRDESRRGSTLAGAHSDSVRGFLNLLVGRSATTEEDNEWMDLGDEDENEFDVETPRIEVPKAVAPDKTPPPQTSVDARQFERMVRAYETNVTENKGLLGPSDVLRVRFWLMLLLHKARKPGLSNGLEPRTDEQGWPRMALRVISAFFCGHEPPLKRLMIAREYTEMPVDYLECWATVLWTLDAIKVALAGSTSHRQFLGYVQKARTDVLKILGLTEAELDSQTVRDLRVALDHTIGARLGIISNTAA